LFLRYCVQRRRKPIGGPRVPEFPRLGLFCCSACIGALTGDSIGDPQTHDAGSISTEFFNQLFYASLGDPQVPCPLPKPQNREQFVASIEPTHAANRPTCFCPQPKHFLHSYSIGSSPQTVRRRPSHHTTRPLCAPSPARRTRHGTLGLLTYIRGLPSRSPSTPPPICRPKWQTRSS
jgi:hypothetical protein